MRCRSRGMWVFSATTPSLIRSLWTISGRKFRSPKKYWLIYCIIWVQSGSTSRIGCITRQRRCRKAIGATSFCIWWEMHSCAFGIETLHLPHRLEEKKLKKLKQKTVRWCLLLLLCTIVFGVSGISISKFALHIKNLRYFAHLHDSNLNLKYKKM